MKYLHLMEVKISNFLKNLIHQNVSSLKNVVESNV
ncbi:hypothetical protein SPAB_03013 [Salmonella enterica subsp. enterica serovar Paratyphi B str. SPB7]|uniref:Uncharacterized protein n=1 Tax=Salmonella paratyphi B (strain ATCC BAA-1250 / SPB7) TaxID=1016998 RepID=A0A6C6Z4Q1_SALPB|nr:hypothetical protein SPAB_03013 [Salmonella enterica subsp. enterica serovar Paratyphi B str. SPB7]